MSNVPAMLTQQAPTYALVQTKGPSSFAAALLGGVGGGGVKRLSIKQARWRIYEGAEEVAVKNEPHIDVAVVRANPNINKQFFIKDYAPGQEAEAPDCYSNDGVTPAADVRAKQCDTCGSCPKNVWGSKITPSGSKIKACADRKLLAVKFADQLLDEGGDILRLAVPGASLKDLGAATRQLVARGVDPAAVIFRVSFDLQAEYPKLTFAPLRYMTNDEYACAKEDESSVEAMYATTELDGAATTSDSAPAQDPLGQPPTAAMQLAAPQAQAQAQAQAAAEQQDAAPRRRRTAPQQDVPVAAAPAPDIVDAVVVVDSGSAISAALESAWDD